MMRQQRMFLVFVCAGLFTASGFARGASAQQPATPPAPTQSAEVAVLVGAGDIANCEVANGAGAVATARVLDRVEGTVITMGDNAYPAGAMKSFQECYGPSWGRHKARTRPAPGNHDYKTNEGAAYFEYFGENAGPDRRGYYSYDLGGWHIISLNSTVDATRNSPQIKWLIDDLAKNPSACTLAYWHIPVFSSGAHGGDLFMIDAYKALYEAKADVVVSGHDHDYERFAPQDPKGKADPDRGIRQFVVGTGGGGVYNVKRIMPNSEVRANRTYGVIKFTLGVNDYSWEFIAAAGEPFTDKGTAQCVR